MRSLIGTFRNFANARKKGHVSVTGNKVMCIQKRRPTQTAFSCFEVSGKHSGKQIKIFRVFFKATSQDTMLMHYCTLPYRTHIRKCHHFLEFRSKALIPVLENVKFVRNSRRYLGRTAKYIYLKISQFFNFVFSIYKYTSPSLWNREIWGLFGTKTITCF